MWCADDVVDGVDILELLVDFYFLFFHYSVEFNFSVKGGFLFYYFLHLFVYSHSKILRSLICVWEDPILLSFSLNSSHRYLCLLRAYSHNGIHCIVARSPSHRISLGKGQI